MTTDMQQLWNQLNKLNEFAFISHLQKDEQWDPIEFHLSGIRFVDRMMERILKFGTFQPNRSNILEIGCGVGRFLRPLAGRFHMVCGVDIAEEMLKSAAKHCSCLPNIVLLQSDGKTLDRIEHDSFNYCVTAGVFQHITDFEAISSYIREALRILKPGGIFLFQFEGNRTEDQGSGQHGARITADKLDAALLNEEFQILEISQDPTDKVRSLVIVLQKTPGVKWTGSFRTFPMTNEGWLEGVYDDFKTKTQMHKRQADQKLRLTFYDK